MLFCHVHVFFLAAGSLPEERGHSDVEQCQGSSVPHRYWALDLLANDCDRKMQLCRHLRYQNQLVLTLAHSSAGFSQGKKPFPFSGLSLHSLLLLSLLISSVLLPACPTYTLLAIVACQIWGLLVWRRHLLCSVPALLWLSLCQEVSFHSASQQTPVEHPPFWNCQSAVRWLPEQFPQASEIPHKVISCLVTSVWNSFLGSLFFLKEKRKETFN